MKSTRIVRTAIGLSILAISVLMPANLLAQKLPPNLAATFWIHDPASAGIWFNANNWSNGAPNANLAAVINNGGAAVIDLDPAHARTLFLGGANRSEIDQVGGSLEVVENMWLGRFGRLGQYNLSAGQVSSQNTFVSSGWAPTDAASGWLGSFFNQSGGDNTVEETLHVGWPLPIIQPAPHPVPHLLSAVSVDTVVAEVMDPSFAPIRPIAVYLQTAGTLSTGRTFVGFGGTGIVGQTGGINQIRKGLHVGGGFNAFPPFLPNGIFVQTGGVTLAGSAHVGQSGSGLVLQTGGHLGIGGNMQIGGTSPWRPHPIPLDPARPVSEGDLTFAPVRPDGDYIMYDGSLATNNTTIGLNGKFHQIWGTHDVAGSLLIGGHPHWPWPIPLDGTTDPTGVEPGTSVDPVPVHPPHRSRADYILDNGELNAGWVHVGQRGRGSFQQNGGTATVRHALRVGGFWWWWPGLLEQSSLDAGNATGSLVSPNNDLHRLPPNATYTLNDGDLATRVSDVSGGGTFRQRGGNHDTHLLQIGGFPFWPVLDADQAVESQATASGDILAAAIAPVDPTRPIPDIEPWRRSRGTYIMHGGRLTADRIDVGLGGNGKMIQRRGAVQVAGVLNVGSNFWWPWRNSAESVAVAPDIGVILPPNRPFPLNATYTLHRGDLTTVATQLGGSSQFNQTGGKHRIETVLRIGGFPDWPTPLATGDVTRPEIWPVPVPFRSRYNMSGGELFVGRVEIGAPAHPWIALPAGSPNELSFAPPRRTGTFRQTGGRVEISSTLDINGGGNYSLARGELNARIISINGGFDFFAHNAVLSQSGGLLKVNKINIGAEAFILGGGTTDPTNEVAPTIVPSFPPLQQYALRGGQAEALNIFIGGPGRSQLTQTGGELNVGNSLHVAGPNASYSIADGSVDVGELRVGTPVFQPDNGGLSIADPSSFGGHLAIGPDADVTVHSNLVFGPDSTLRAALGSTVVMRGANFQNLSTNENALSALNRLTVEFGSGVFTDPLSTFELGGEDFGFSNEGFDKNFALDTLQVGDDSDVTQLQLVDLFDNQPNWVGDEALYVTNLIVGSGSTLDLNGLNIYYINGSFGDGGGIIDSKLGGSPSVPEPAAVLMLGCGVLVGLRRRLSR